MNKMKAHALLCSQKIQSLADQIEVTANCAYETGLQQGSIVATRLEDGYNDWRKGGWGIVIGFGPQDKASNIAITHAFAAISAWVMSVNLDAEERFRKEEAEKDGE